MSTTWEEIDRQTYECYIDYITCDLDPNSPPLEEGIQLDQMDEDVSHIDDMLPTTLSEGGNIYYSYDDFSFFDMREEHEKLIEGTVYESHTVKTSYISIRSLFVRQKIIVMVLVVIVVW